MHQAVQATWRALFQASMALSVRLRTDIRPSREIRDRNENQSSLAHLIYLSDMSDSIGELAVAFQHFQILFPRRWAYYLYEKPE
jgi:hypothetical protein